MRLIFGLVLIAGLGLAGFAVFMVNDYLGSQQVQLQRERARAAQRVDVVEVVAASRPLVFGDSLRAEDVATIQYAAPFLPDGAFTTMEDLFPEGTDVVRSMIRPVERNEIILRTDVTRPGQLASIAQKLDPQLRAFTIRVDASTGVSGFLRPGDKVDIFWTGSVGGRRGDDETHRIGSSISLVAVDQSTDRNLTTTKISSTVTVQVSPDDVARLAQAQADGRLSLALVGRDAAQVTVPAGDQAIFLPEAPVEISAAPAPVATPVAVVSQDCSTSVRRGAEAIEVDIDCSR